MKASRRRTLLAPKKEHRPSTEELFHAPGESPAVHSMTQPIVFPAEVLGSAFTLALVRCVEGIRDWATQQKYLVGHIKVFVETAQKENLWLGTTGKRINLKASPGWDAAHSEVFQVHFTAIIFGPGDAQVKQVVAEWIQREFEPVHP